MKKTVAKKSVKSVKSSKPSKTVKPSKSVAKSAAKSSTGRGRGRPKGSKNKMPSKKSGGSKPEQIVASGSVVAVDNAVVVSHETEQPSTIIERSASVASNRSSN